MPIQLVKFVSQEGFHNPYIIPQGISGPSRIIARGVYTWVITTTCRGGPCGYHVILTGSIWGFPKIRGTLLRVPIIRIIISWGLYWGPPI